MADGLEQLEQEVVLDLLNGWLEVYDEAEAAYDSFPERTKRWVDENGHRVKSLVPVVAFMQPDVRVLCRYLVEIGKANLDPPLSHPTPSVEGTDVRVESRGVEMDRVAELEEQVRVLADAVDELEEWKQSVTLALQTVSVALDPRHMTGTDG